MTKETNLEGNIVYTCEKCGWMYKDRKMAEKCEAYCRGHNACNLRYVRVAIKLNKLMT